MSPLQTTAATSARTRLVSSPADTRFAWDAVPKTLFSMVKMLLRLNPKQEKKQPASGQHIQLTNPWHAVSIETEKHCCSASIATKNQRYLATQAPRLPLAGCTQSACRCVYKHHDDRRRSARRAGEQEGRQREFSSQAMPVELRQQHGRRSTDGC